MKTARLAVVQPPFRYNRLKHQGRWLAWHLQCLPSMFIRWPNLLHALGRSQFDTYFGPLSCQQIFWQITRHLSDRHCWKQDAYLDWIKAGKGYQLLSLSDTSGWVLRAGEQTTRYIHLHPARYSNHSRRIKAAVYKIIISCMAYQQLTKVWPTLSLQNIIRAQHALPASKQPLSPNHPIKQWLTSLSTDC